MRFAILGISHETNTFSRVPTDYAQFEASDILRGQEMVDRFDGSLYTIAGYLQAGRELGFEAVPLMWAQTGPLATITRGRLRPAHRRDVRHAPGPGTVGRRPHRQPRRGRVGAVSLTWMPPSPSRSGRSSDLTCRSPGRWTCTATCRSASSRSPTSRWSGGPTRTSTPSRAAASAPSSSFGPSRARSGRSSGSRRRRWSSTSSSSSPAMEPMKTLVADCVEANERPGILDTSIAEGYPYADVEEMGMAWVAIADGDLDAAQRRRALDGGTRLGASRRAEPACSVDPRGARVGRPPLPGAAPARRCRRRPRRWHAAVGAGHRSRGRRRSRAPAGPDRADGRRRQHRRRLLGRLDAHPGRGAADGHHLVSPDAVRPRVRSPPASRRASAPRSRWRSAPRPTIMHGRPVAVTGTVRTIVDGRVGGPRRDPRRLPVLRRRSDRSASTRPTDTRCC